MAMDTEALRMGTLIRGGAENFLISSLPCLKSESVVMETIPIQTKHRVFRQNLKYILTMLELRCHQGLSWKA